MSNPMQWPSFTNLSAWYSEHSRKRLKLLEAVVILVQCWWRRRKDSSVRLNPIVLERFWDASGALAGTDPVLDKHVVSYEKLDGTNLGVRCDGLRFGRRQIVSGTSDQKCQLDDIVPTGTQVSTIKTKIEQMVSMDLPKFLVYGELMVNNKFDYIDRKLFKTWICFGAMCTEYEGINRDSSMQKAKSTSRPAKRRRFLRYFVP
jgi:hypothetical protein